MSVRSFHSVFMASAVAGAALGCYLVSLRVASERAALESVESAIVETQSDIRLLQTEIGTRARLSQLERWNVRALALSAPTADQILGDKFQLAKLVRPEDKPAMEAPVVLAAAPAPLPAQPLAESPQQAAVGELLHEASFEVPDRAVEQQKMAPPAKPHSSKAVAGKAADSPAKKAGDKSSGSSAAAMTKPVRTAKIDPLAPLPAGHPTAKGSRTTQ